MDATDGEAAARSGSPPPPTAAQSSRSHITTDELQRLLDACVISHPDLGSPIYVAATSAVRRGELCGLR